MTEKPLAVFRCDASSRTGGGHVLRSMTLARGLERDGWRVAFAIGGETLASVPALAQAGWRVEAGFDAADMEPARFRRLWPEGARLAVIDHYGRAASDEQALRPWARHCLVIDDLAAREHVCEVLLDTAVGRVAAHYQGLVAPGTELLLGPAYALIREEFHVAAAQASTTIAQRSAAPVRRVLLAFGMTDLGGITDRVAGLLLALAPALRFEAIVGPNGEGRAALEARARAEPRLTVHVAPPNVALIMARTDLAVGAGGQTTFERCCLGLPSIALSIADNQKGALRALARRGALLHVNAMPRLDETALAQAFTDLAASPDRRRAMAEAAGGICDGGGVARIVRHLRGLKA